MRRAADTAYGRLGTVMDAAFEAMLRDLRVAGASVRVLGSPEVRAFEQATRWREVQDGWVRQQEQTGVMGVRAMLQALREQVGAAVAAR